MAAINLVSVENVSVSHGTRTLLDQVSLGLGEAERIGVVGLNGAGKSTLLRVLTKAEQPDSGRVTHRGGLRLGHLTQSVVFPDDALVRDVVIGSAWLPAAFGAEHEWAGDARIRTVLDGLGLHTIGLDAPVRPLSGGERRRVALAALLVRDTDLLVLDEPTNHLDVEGVAWLAEYLVGRRGGLLVVTHDRWFLDAVCTRTWEVTDGQVEQYEGGYAAWVLARAERSRQAAAAEERRQNLMRKELAWLRRGAPARTSKPKFRIEAANALIADVPEPRDTVQLKRLAGTRIGKQVYDVEDASLSFGDRTILNRVTWRIGPGDRYALVGVNGAGKSTLLRLLAEQNRPDSGEVKVGKTVKAAYLSQEVVELPPTLRVLEAVEEVARRLTVGDRDLTASQLAEMFGFSSARQWTPVGDLSGGERRRLQLLRLLMAGPNVLLLDEPTNDLDIDTLQALEDLLDSWPGTLVVVSHDRYLVERVTDQVWALLGDGALRMLTGGIDEYLQRRAAAGAGSGRPGPASSGAGSPAGVGDGSDTAADGEAAGLSAADQRAAKKELSRLERQIAKLEERERKLHDRLAEHSTDFAKVAELDAELRGLQAEREAAEESWLELSEHV
ncbi:ABC-F family ATP-binding cassette domain-containing protein [Cryptosporangium aurantiacum]|uniref:ATPase components of ABC transporters with duplicated ATPase domains n=1 Tax=Cryptosporangium aurantiacum TaxID=134849 RepID=A0A1M7RJQ1_9ACTN|nr:ABC-F family ATP-binding cassette domain-containing protein [Cryptosporangium aurantiacum]SHN46381.1 ATPase components of ABC transporters with duplicated ATPase domains [Cryptosporangium aurantiacum]